MQTSSVYYGDCFKHLTHWNNWDEDNNARLAIERQLADLIYLDPPWNSDANYNILYEPAANKELGHTAQSTAFTDVWEFGAEYRLKRFTEEPISQSLTDPFYPLAAERLRECIKGLKLVLGHTGMLAYITYMAERLTFCRELLKETGSIYLHCDPYASHCDNLGGVKMEKSGKIVDAVIVLETKTDKPLIVELFSTNVKTSDWIEQIKEDGISAIEINISSEAWKKR